MKTPKVMKMVSAILSLMMVLSMALPSFAATMPDQPENLPENLQVDWNARYQYKELEAQLKAIAEAYPAVTEMYEVGRTWQERALWCMEITDESTAKEEKTGIAVIGNIHGGERESGASAMYFAWWLAVNSEDEAVQQLLKDYVVYVIPVMNADGYDQSFVVPTRENLRPRDLNGNGVPFSDPYTDIDGDGYISYLFAGSSTDDLAAKVATSPYAIYSLMRSDAYIGRESPDWDNNGIPGDDPRNSGIDMNRTFDYQWNRYDIETRNSETGVIGTNSWSSAGSAPATEPEVKAIQNFLIKTDINALVTLHTGIQSVLYPWCYRPYDAAVDSDDILFMKDTAEKMAAAYQETTGRGFYTKSSYDDYPTSAEMIDYAYGRLNIHAYTIEVYNGGKSATGSIEDCKWENTLPEATCKFYTKEEVEAMGLKLNIDAEGVWFYTTSTDQMVDKAPENQDLLVKGCRDAILVMMESEPAGTGKTVPYWLQ